MTSKSKKGTSDTSTQALIIPADFVTNKIHLIRGQKVMLDRDLAELYDIKPIRLREQVKRNVGRFPENFMFQLSDILLQSEKIETKLARHDEDILLIFEHLKHLLNRDNPYERK